MRTPDTIYNRIFALCEPLAVTTVLILVCRRWGKTLAADAADKAHKIRALTRLAAANHSESAKLLRAGMQGEAASCLQTTESEAARLFNCGDVSPLRARRHETFLPLLGVVPCALLDLRPVRYDDLVYADFLCLQAQVDFFRDTVALRLPSVNLWEGLHGAKDLAPLASFASLRALSLGVHFLALYDGTPVHLPALTALDLDVRGERHSKDFARFVFLADDLVTLRLSGIVSYPSFVSHMAAYPKLRSLELAFPVPGALLRHVPRSVRDLYLSDTKYWHPRGAAAATLLEVNRLRPATLRVPHLTRELCFALAAPGPLASGIAELWASHTENEAFEVPVGEKDVQEHPTVDTGACGQSPARLLLGALPSLARVRFARGLCASCSAGGGDAAPDAGAALWADLRARCVSSSWFRHLLETPEEKAMRLADEKRWWAEQHAAREVEEARLAAERLLDAQQKVGTLENLQLRVHVLEGEMRSLVRRQQEGLLGSWSAARVAGTRRVRNVDHLSS